MSKREINVFETTGRGSIHDGTSFVKVSFDLRQETTVVSNQHDSVVAKLDISGKMKPDNQEDWAQLSRWAAACTSLSLAPQNSIVIEGVKLEQDGSFRVFGNS
jgi:hypothetical protein